MRFIQIEGSLLTNTEIFLALNWLYNSAVVFLTILDLVVEQGFFII